MKIIEKILVPAKEQSFTTGTVCDMCASSHRGDNWPIKGNTDGCYAVNTVTIERRIGSNYPEGGNVIQQSADICPTCWDTKVVPWFRSQGVELSEEDVSW